jgi:hypothetical protein
MNHTSKPITKLPTKKNYQKSFMLNVDEILSTNAANLFTKFKKAFERSLYI